MVILFVLLIAGVSLVIYTSITNSYLDAQDAHMEYLLEGPDEYYTSPEDIAFYKKEIAPYLFIPDIAASRLLFNGDEPFWTVIDNLLEGRLTDDQFIAELDSLCKAVETGNP